MTNDTTSDTLHDRLEKVDEIANRLVGGGKGYEDIAEEAIEYAAQLEDQVESLVDPDVEKLVYEDGVLEAWLGDAPALKLLTANLGKTLDEHEAGNYLQVELKAEEQPEPYKVVVHRPGAKTPHEKREEAEAERDEARAERDRALDVLEKVHPDYESDILRPGGVKGVPEEKTYPNCVICEVLREVERGDTVDQIRREAFEEAAQVAEQERGFGGSVREATALNIASLIRALGEADDQEDAEDA